MKNDQEANDRFNRSASMGRISHLPSVEIHKYWKNYMAFVYWKTEKWVKHSLKTQSLI